VPGATDDDAAQRFAAMPVARLATVGRDGAPHLVPVVFAVEDNVVFSAVDGKPKSTQRLRRLANIEGNPAVSLLVDHYDSDWSRLWWVRADGTAQVHDDDRQAARGRAALRAKYPQYETVSLSGPVIAVTVRRWSSWGLGS
jgi:PPOX class probable F420-dependent enzyme